jgi:hypothetical protein
MWPTGLFLPSALGKLAGSIVLDGFRSCRANCKLSFRSHVCGVGPRPAPGYDGRRLTARRHSGLEEPPGARPVSRRSAVARLALKAQSCRAARIGARRSGEGRRLRRTGRVRTGTTSGRRSLRDSGDEGSRWRALPASTGLARSPRLPAIGMLTRKGGDRADPEGHEGAGLTPPFSASTRNRSALAPFMSSPGRRHRHLRSIEPNPSRMIT